MATTNPLQFIQQVRSEVSKVVWPTRREVLLTTVMVFIMAALTAVFFALVDLGIREGSNQCWGCSVKRSRCATGLLNPLVLRSKRHL